MGLIAGITKGFLELAVAAYFFGVVAENMDTPMVVPLVDDTYQLGRTKNAIASVISGVVAQKMYDNSTIDVEVCKWLWPDSHIDGRTTPNSIYTYMDLFMFTKSEFIADRKNADNSVGPLRGRVHKSELDWKINQLSENSYEIVRWGPKFNNRLDITVDNGRINGMFVRPWLHFDWRIEGEYDEDGNMFCHIYEPWGIDFYLEGTITPTR